MFDFPVSAHGFYNDALAAGLTLEDTRYLWKCAVLFGDLESSSIEAVAVVPRVQATMNYNFETSVLVPPGYWKSPGCERLLNEFALSVSRARESRVRSRTRSPPLGFSPH